MAIDTTTTRSRRAVLFGALGAAVASAAAVLGRPAIARADDTNPIALGTSPTPPFDGSGTNEATTTTAIATTLGHGFAAQTADATATSPGDRAGLLGTATATTGVAAGVMGVTKSGDYQAAAVFGYAAATTGYTIGVQGQSDGDIGSGVAGFASGTTGFTIGTEGDCASPNGAGTWGWNWAHGTGATGIVGANYHDTSSVATDTGVLGVASDATGSTIGVMGRAVSTDGTGVIGVIGPDNLSPTANTGVYGQSVNGTGGWFATGGLKMGTALRTTGRVRFDNSVGVATVPSGKNKVVVTPGIDLTATSAVVATLQGNAGGSTTVRYVAVNATADTFIIFLTGNATAAVKVAWHVFG